ncbi:MAG: NAD(P)H-dependent oxidoreductase [Candidatus Saccharimonadales bacterium]
MTKIAVIIGSTRQGRQSDKLAKWVAAEAGKLTEVELLDLRDYPLPFFDEAISPRYNPDRKPSVAAKKWLDKVAEFDGYVLVTPEYNRSTSAVLKNALEYTDYQMDNKPVALVAHGTTGGAQAVANLRLTLPGNGVVSIPQALFFSDHLADSISDNGELKQELREKPYGPQTQLDSQIESLVWYADALKAARK